MRWGSCRCSSEDYAEAQAAFTRSLKLGYRESAAIYLGLGQAAEGLKRVDEAIAWYQKVESGDWVRAQLKIATLVARQQGLAAGREYLQRIQPRSTEDRVQMIQVEAQLLRDAKAWRETYDMLSKAVDAYPDSYEILYDRAMAAERVDLIDVLEADLAARDQDEAGLCPCIQRAGLHARGSHQSPRGSARPDRQGASPLARRSFILDSLGWVHYRLGNTQEALRHLQPRLLHAARSGDRQPIWARCLWKSGPARRGAEDLARGAHRESQPRDVVGGDPEVPALTPALSSFRRAAQPLACRAPAGVVRDHARPIGAAGARSRPAQFEMSGRLAVRQGDRSEIARLRWTHAPAADSGSSPQPLGNEVARIESSAGGATLTQAGGERPRVGELLRRSPRGCSAWRSIPRRSPGGCTAPRSRRPGGWNVTLDEKAARGQPSRSRGGLSAIRGDVVVRLVVDEYRVGAGVGDAASRPGLSRARQAEPLPARGRPARRRLPPAAERLPPDRPLRQLRFGCARTARSAA
jgi:tetratricopeptide (TPR) repeat protein